MKTIFAAFLLWPNCVKASGVTVADHQAYGISLEVIQSSPEKWNAIRLMVSNRSEKPLVFHNDRYTKGFTIVVKDGNGSEVPTLRIFNAGAGASSESFSFTASEIGVNEQCAIDVDLLKEYGSQLAKGKTVVFSWEPDWAFKGVYPSSGKPVSLEMKLTSEGLEKLEEPSAVVEPKRVQSSNQLQSKPEKLPKNTSPKSQGIGDQLSDPPRHWGWWGILLLAVVFLLLILRKVLSRRS